MNDIDIENSVLALLVGSSRLMRPHEVRAATENYLGPGRWTAGFCAATHLQPWLMHWLLREDLFPSD